MELIDISGLLAASRLSLPTLNVLSADERLYKIALLQLEANIITSDNGLVANSDAKIRNFIELSNEQNADVVVTPEYSCPWDSLRQLFSEGRVPLINSLWVI